MILLSYIFLVIAVLAQANGQCVMYGTCDEDDVTMLSKPCVYNGSPIPLANQSAIEVVMEFCPSLNISDNFSVCCDASQVDAFSMQLEILAALFKRCPSCFHNLANLFCHLVCSPVQSTFLEVTSVGKNNSVDEISYYITDHYVTGMFDSCKNVKLASTSEPVISIACGGNKVCDPHLWVEYMGGHDPSPYQMNFQFYNTSDVNETKFDPMNATIVPCSEALVPGGPRCSCLDCPCNGQCVMYGTCDEDDLTMLSKPCVYNGSSIPLADQKAMEVLKELCPSLNIVDNISVCCDASQVDALSTQLGTLAALFKRCPSCFHNLANLFCHQVCSPVQSTFLEVTSVGKNNSVDAINYYITDDYVTGMFDSCKNVKLASTSEPAISIACGGNKVCDPHLWVEYMGGHDPSPYQMNFQFYNSSDVNETKFDPMNATIFSCSEALAPGGSRCSCVDCPCNGQCVMYGTCDEDDLTMLSKPCVYDGSPIPLADQKAIEVVKELCPSLNTGDNFSVCCDASQVDAFSTQLETLASLFKRCPSCFHNLANLFCHLVCSPVQSSFLEVTTVGKNNSVDEMSYYITDHYVTGMFDSCKNVQLAFTSKAAISITCGGNKVCDPHLWVEYMGGHDPSPYQMNFQFYNTSDVNETKFDPMNATIFSCSEALAPGGSPCSCVDCPCGSDPPPLPYHDDRKVLGLPLIAGIMLIVWIFLAVVIIGGFVYNGFKKRNDDEELLLMAAGQKWQKAPTLCARWGAALDMWLKRVFTVWGTFCASYPVPVLLSGLVFVAIFSAGLVFFTVRTNPVELWCAPSSEVREQKDYFDKHFGPFYRTEQIIITRNTTDPVIAGNLNFSSVFDREFLHKILDLQNNITSILAERNNRTIRFEDICFAPVTKRKCMIQSAVNWFQNDPEHLDYYNTTEDYLQFLKSCTNNPMFLQKKGLSCLGEYGGPVFPYVALGGVQNSDYASASALILTFMVQNHLKDEDNQDAIAWEKLYLEFMKNFSDPDMHFAFTSERSIQDELDRQSQADETTVIISYMVMFIYVSITLGQYHSCGMIFVKSKILLGLSGVLIVLASVISSIGVFSYFGVPATLIIIEVIPFLVLAVGVDNIFIIVQSYQRSKRGIHETREQHIGRVVGQTIPSILLASFAESACFFIGALSTMPAVHVFALYSGLALLIDFLLQISCFVAVLSLDAAREDSGRFDCCCCVKVSKPDPTPKQGFLYKLFEKIYAPFLMKNPVRCIVLLLFSGWLCTSISVLEGIEVGLDQKLAMPKDSYVLEYFKSLEKYLSVGPPVYFVVKSGYKYENIQDQNSLCSVPFCNRESLVAQISDASHYSNRTYIAHPPMDWLDTYISWANEQTSCCRVYRNDTSQFCPSTEKRPICNRCEITSKTNLRPYPENFTSFLLDFLGDNPNADCPVGGHAAFASALEINDGEIGATHYMTYHTILKTSKDFTEALRWARKISENITDTLHFSNGSDPNAEVFPYSIFYVFYEQYLSVTKDTIINILVSMATIFVVTLLLTGLDIHSTCIMVFTILMILQDLLGLMYFWDISLNAVSLVNLVMAIGISVEFCSHIIRSFAFSTEGTKVDRARNAVAHMGSSVLSGITLTKFGGIVVLAFSKSQIFQVFYFRMYLGIVLIGAAHGLIFLPVFLSVAGPPIKIKIQDESRGRPLKASLDEEGNVNDVRSDMQFPGDRPDLLPPPEKE